MLWQVALNSNQPVSSFVTAEDILTVIEIMEKQNGK
jgi:hypothetical protein